WERVDCRLAPSSSRQVAPLRDSLQSSLRPSRQVRRATPAIPPPYSHLPIDSIRPSSSHPPTMPLIPSLPTRCAIPTPSRRQSTLAFWSRRNLTTIILLSTPRLPPLHRLLPPCLPRRPPLPKIDPPTLTLTLTFCQAASFYRLRHPRAIGITSAPSPPPHPTAPPPRQLASFNISPSPPTPLFQIAFPPNSPHSTSSTPKCGTSELRGFKDQPGRRQQRSTISNDQ
ncbi:hypothetical protein R3P38DRAFT_697498, partial [Favolaschia claudopus]